MKEQDFAIFAIIANFKSSKQIIFSLRNESKSNLTVIKFVLISHKFTSFEITSQGTNRLKFDLCSINLFIDFVKRPYTNSYETLFRKRNFLSTKHSTNL